MAPFTLDTQWHISVVLKKDGNGGTVRSVTSWWALP